MQRLDTAIANITAVSRNFWLIKLVKKQSLIWSIQILWLPLQYGTSSFTKTVQQVKETDEINMRISWSRRLALWGCFRNFLFSSYYIVVITFKGSQEPIIGSWGSIFLAKDSFGIRYVLCTIHYFFFFCKACGQQRAKTRKSWVFFCLFSEFSPPPPPHESGYFFKTHILHADRNHAPEWCFLIWDRDWFANSGR